MINRKKPNSTFQQRFLTSLKLSLYIEDIMIVANVGYDRAHRIKKEILSKYNTLYPIPTEIVLEHLHIDEARLERSAMKEKKLGIKNESAPTDSRV